MNTTEILLVVIVLGILAIDIAVRLVIAPHKRDQYVEDLLNILHEPHPVPNVKPSHTSMLLPFENLGDALLKHFMQSSLSCQILEILATSNVSMSEADIAIAVNNGLIAKERRALPDAAIRKVIMILMGADFVRLRHGALSLTDLGKNLHGVLQQCRAASRESALGCR